MYFIIYCVALFIFLYVAALRHWFTSPDSELLILRGGFCSVWTEPVQLFAVFMLSYAKLTAAGSNLTFEDPITFLFNTVTSHSAPKMDVTVINSQFVR